MMHMVYIHVSIIYICVCVLYNPICQYKLELKPSQMKDLQMWNQEYLQFFPGINIFTCGTKKVCTLLSA